MNTITIITAATLILSGTIAGYITNKYAVKWLFKPVSIFGRKIFDVSILSTDEKQDTFIESLSDCVEQKILTNEVLKKEIINETMKSHIDEIVEHFISEALPESFKSIKLSDLKGFAQTDTSLKEFIGDILDKNADSLLVHILEEIKVSEYVTEVQIQSGVDNLYDSMKHTLSTNPAIKEQLTRILTEMFFSAMFNADARTAIGKLTAKLFKGNPFSDMSSMSLPEKISITIKNIISSAVSGVVENKSVNSYAKPETRDMINKKLQKEILDKYEAAINNLSDRNISSISTLISKSERIKRTVSDMIYDYINRNINKLLGGKVKETVKMALGRLDPNQLCDIAQRLLKGELKYLSYFGGVLGFIVSIPALFVTFGQFSVTGFPENPLMFAFLIIIMGFIGVITNVIAIKMFFRPYRKIKTLAQFKHTKVFSQGLILQNQPVFAHTLGEYIGQELLTAENIKKMLDGYNDQFISQLSANIAPYIFSYFNEEANKKNASAKISAFALNKAYEKREVIGDYLGLAAGNRTFGSLIDMNNPDIRNKAFELYNTLLNKISIRPTAGEGETYEFQFIAYALSNLIKGNASLKEKVWNLLEAFYNTEIADKSIVDFLSISELSASIKDSVAKICGNNDAFNDFRVAVNNCIYKLTENNDKIISKDFIEDVSVRCSEAIYDSTVECIPNLVEDIHISDITEKKVASLEPDEIQKVVLSFAAPVFKKLYALGCIGCVFGLNTYLAFILYIIDKITDKSQ